MKNLTLNQKQLIFFGLLFVAVATTVIIMAAHGVIHFDSY